MHEERAFAKIRSMIAEALAKSGKYGNKVTRHRRVTSARVLIGRRTKVR